MSSENSQRTLFDEKEEYALRRESEEYALLRLARSPLRLKRLSVDKTVIENAINESESNKPQWD